MSRFDWYQATVGAEVDEVAASFLRQCELSDLVPSTPRNGYERGAKVVRGEVDLVHLLWGGVNPGVNVRGTGDKAPMVAGLIRGSGWQHSCSRVDVCDDFRQEGLFESMSASLRKYAVKKGIRVNHQGDWTRGEGRTLYLGSRKSNGQVVLYEKGFEVGGDAPRDWVRLEVRVYPKGRTAKELVSSLSPDECRGVVPWIRGAVRDFVSGDLDGASVSTVWRKEDSLRARRALLKQYGNTLRNWADELGSFDALGSELERCIEGGVELPSVEEIEL